MASSKWLPSIDGMLVPKPKAKSAHRHAREKISVAVELSPSTLRRGLYVKEHGTLEVKELCEKGELSIWRAYQITRLRVGGETFRLMESLVKQHPEILAGVKNHSA